jgi:methylated-DNA-[protein]-cysteine S-methyltransferase
MKILPPIFVEEEWDKGDEVEYLTFKTSFGWVGVSASEKGLKTIILPQPTELQARGLLRSEALIAGRPSDKLADLAERLEAYFDGRKAGFTDELDFTGATPFQIRVWEQARRIPFGETRSYQWVAGQTGKPGAARAVGQALGKNPFPIIVPCHRVVASDGGLGGFSGGLDMKRRLLKLEGIISPLEKGR